MTFTDTEEEAAVRLLSDFACFAAEHCRENSEDDYCGAGRVADVLISSLFFRTFDSLSDAQKTHIMRCPIFYGVFEETNGYHLNVFKFSHVFARCSIAEVINSIDYGDMKPLKEVIHPCNVAICKDVSGEDLKI